MAELEMVCTVYQAPHAKIDVGLTKRITRERIKMDSLKVRFMFDGFMIRLLFVNGYFGRCFKKDNTWI